MTPTSPSRRDVLKAGAVITAAASIGLGEAFTARRAHAQGGAAQSRARIDGVLKQAVDAKEVPGVVAMAATDKGKVYEGAFGTRDLGKGPDMTLDTFFRIASMTKAITCTAALQLVEQGKLKVDDPVPAIDPALSSPQVLDGFDAAGAPILRPVKRPITLRHLMTHTAGFSYEVWDGNTQRYVKVSGMPSTATGKVAALRMPLVFDPGDKWEYGVNIDWVGRIVESVSGQPIDAYFKDRIFGPLNMKDTGFVSSPEQRARQASVHQRQADGSLVPQPLETPFLPEFYAGGGGLYSTANDYLSFLQMLLNGGSFEGKTYLKPETFKMMATDYVAPGSGVERDFFYFPGDGFGFGLGLALRTDAGNTKPSPPGSVGELKWDGASGCYFVVDRKQDMFFVLMEQTPSERQRIQRTLKLLVYEALEK